MQLPLVVDFGVEPGARKARQNLRVHLAHQLALETLQDRENQHSLQKKIPGALDRMEMF